MQSQQVVVYPYQPSTELAGLQGTRMRVRQPRSRSCNLGRMPRLVPCAWHSSFANVESNWYKRVRRKTTANRMLCPGYRWPSRRTTHHDAIIGKSREDGQFLRVPYIDKIMVTRRLLGLSANIPTARFRGLVSPRRRSQCSGTVDGDWQLSQLHRRIRSRIKARITAIEVL